MRPNQMQIISWSRAAFKVVDDSKSRCIYWCIYCWQMCILYLHWRGSAVAGGGWRVGGGGGGGWATNHKAGG